MKKSRMTVLAAVGLALCCGVPVLVASGALAAAAGAAARWWPLVGVGAALLIYASIRIYRPVSAIRTNTKRRIDERSR